MRTRSNNTAELTALLRAVEKELERPPLPVEICVDSRYALGLADGRWLAPRKRNTDLAKRLRASVRALIRQRGHRNVTLSHVRAHARTPGNEAADQLAKSAARDDGEAKDPMRALALASNTHRTVRGVAVRLSGGFWGEERHFTQTFIFFTRRAAFGPKYIHTARKAPTTLTCSAYTTYSHILLRWLLQRPP